MRTYNAIDKVSAEIIKDNICEAIFLKGSIARGDDDEYSDVDMYIVVDNKRIEEFIDSRIKYLSAYKPIVYYSYADFVGPQIIAIFEDGLHFDLYVITKETIPTTDEIKIIYDPNEVMKSYVPQVKYIEKEACVEMFHGILYNFIEADGAYKRRNYPWASRILDHSIANCSILLRYIYDVKYAYLGLKKINEVLPKEQYLWLEEASNNLNKDGYKIANGKIITILEHIVEHIEDDIKEKLNIEFLEWVKKNLNGRLF